MEITLIYPNQLFIDHPAITKDRTIYIVRHPSFFSDYKFHKQKILFLSGVFDGEGSFGLWSKKKTKKYFDSI